MTWRVKRAEVHPFPRSWSPLSSLQQNPAMCSTAQPRSGHDYWGGSTTGLWVPLFSDLWGWNPVEAAGKPREHIRARHRPPAPPPAGTTQAFPMAKWHCPLKMTEQKSLCYSATYWTRKKTSKINLLNCHKPLQNVQ